MKYDATLKELLQAGAPGLWKAMGFEPPDELLTVELPSVHIRKPDFVGCFAKDGALVHLEVQADNDDSMEWRELVLPDAFPAVWPTTDSGRALFRL